MNTPLNPRIDTKTRNKLLLLGELRRTGATSRVDLAAKLGFTKSAVTLLTNELLEEGVLLEKKTHPISSKGADGAG